MPLYMVVFIKIYRAIGMKKGMVQMRRPKNIKGERNRRWLVKFLHDLRDLGFIPYDVSFYDGCFRSERDDESKNCNISFKIRGLKRWTFGAWMMNPPKDSDAPFILKVFCQPTLFLDKFKPSRGWFDLTVYPVMYIGKIATHVPYFELYELEDYLHFMKKHESIFFTCESSITNFDSKIYCSWYMFKSYMQEYYHIWHRKFLHKRMMQYSALGSKLGLIKVAYEKDYFNEEEHINDYFYVYYKNMFGKIIARHILSMSRKDYFLGTVRIENSIVKWKLDYNMFCFDPDVIDNLSEKKLEEEMRFIEDYEKNDKRGSKHFSRLQFFE